MNSIVFAQNKNNQYLNINRRKKQSISIVDGLTKSNQKKEA